MSSRVVFQWTKSGKMASRVPFRWTKQGKVQHILYAGAPPPIKHLESTSAEQADFPQEIRF